MEKNAYLLWHRQHDAMVRDSWCVARRGKSLPTDVKSNKSEAVPAMLERFMGWRRDLAKQMSEVLLYYVVQDVTVALVCFYHFK